MMVETACFPVTESNAGYRTLESPDRTLHHLYLLREDHSKEETRSPDEGTTL